MNRCWQRLCAFTWIAATIVALLGPAAAATDKPAPLVIQEQGSFTAGGKVITTPGVFDPRKPLDLNNVQIADLVSKYLTEKRLD